MSNLNSQHNLGVWFDIPVGDLDRAATFYAAVLEINVSKEKHGDISFCLLEHGEGNGGCLIANESGVAKDTGILVYMNVDGRIQDATAKVTEHGGEILEPPQSIGPPGFRALIRDSEGNRIALHSNSGA